MRMNDLKSSILSHEIMKVSKALKESYSKLLLWEKILAVCLFIGFCCVTYFIFVGARISFNSDTATANLLAREQILSRQFFPENWVYVDGLWTFFVNVPMVFLSVFIKDQLLLRSTAVFLQTLILAFVFYKFSKRILNDNSYLVYATLIFSGISGYTLENLFGQAAYGNQTLFTLLLFYFATLSLDSKLNVSGGKFILFNILLYVSCISGLRQVAVFLVPFIFAVVFVFISENEKIDRDASLKVIKKFAKWFSVVVFSVGMAIASYRFIQTKTYCDQGSSFPMIIAPTDVEAVSRHIWNFISGLWAIFGYEKSAPLFSVIGMVFLFKIVAAIVLVFVFPYLCSTKFGELSTNLKRLLVFSWSSFLVMGILYIVCDTLSVDWTTIRYFQVTIILQLIISSYYIYEYFLKTSLILMLITMIAVITFFSMSLMNTVDMSQDYKAKITPTMNLVTDLRAHNLKLGYASYWNAYKYSVCSNFNPEIVALFGAPLKPYYHLNSRRSYSPDYYGGDTFLMLTDAEYATYWNQEKVEDQFGAPKEIVKSSGYTILIYNYNIAERFLSGLMQNREERDIKPFMLKNGLAQPADIESIVLKKEDVLFGPYMTLEKGRYELFINCEMGKKDKNANLKITENSGTNTLFKSEIIQGTNRIEFKIDKTADAVEFVLTNDLSYFELKEIKLKRVR